MKTQTGKVIADHNLKAGTKVEYLTRTDYPAGYVLILKANDLEFPAPFWELADNIRPVTESTKLTPLEKSVWDMSNKGWAFHTIAPQLNRSERSIAAAYTRAHRKLGLNR